jgi:hypothetical protein
MNLKTHAGWMHCQTCLVALKLSCTVGPINDLEACRWNFVDDTSVEWIKRRHRR